MNALLWASVGFAFYGIVALALQAIGRGNRIQDLETERWFAEKGLTGE